MARTKQGHYPKIIKKPEQPKIHHDPLQYEIIPMAYGKSRIIKMDAPFSYSLCAGW